jgi:hypothetical protein
VHRVFALTNLHLYRSTELAGQNMTGRHNDGHVGSDQAKTMSGGTRAIWTQMIDKFAQSRHYPLGMDSGLVSAASTGPSMRSQPYVESSIPISDANASKEFILDAKTISELVQQAPNTMSVKPANLSRYHYDPELDYKMTARPRGLCLIVNNVDFEHDLLPKRRGSDQDANRFDQLFKQLGFVTIMTRNLTADQMRAKFRELSNACRPEHDALFVFILSHGNEHGIYGTDGFVIDVDSDVLSCFDNKNCKAMKGKPKVFVIQACRGNSKDDGGDRLDSVAVIPANTNQGATNIQQANRVPSSWLPSANRQHDDTSHSLPNRLDMLLVQSCSKGYVSVRNETAGSWLGVSLAYFIMIYAHERDLEKILKSTVTDIAGRISSDGHKQSVEFTGIGWRKSLYFNPGIYI